MDTIAAIATPQGSGGISIIRISGNNALDVINKIFKPIKDDSFKPNMMRLGNIIDETGIIVDQVLVSFFKAPRSYTGEDVIEVNCHAGIVVTRRILNLILNNGARMAEGGEFTKRAFLNGKIDLTQAEAVMELINSKSERESRASVMQLEGRLGNIISEVKDDIIELLADIEANIDYPEYEDIEEVQREKILLVLNRNIEKLKKLEITFDNGKILKDGISTAIIGKPNVGKSSLLNVLLDEERAIVTDIPGTTRDTIEEYVSINGIALKLIDTAGIRETSDVVENIGVEKSKNALNDADLVLFLIDGSRDLTNEDKELYELIKDKKHIVIINKTDLKKNNFSFDDDNVVYISAKERTGIDDLECKIEQLFALNELNSDNEILITNVRHKNLINIAIKGINDAIDTVNLGLPIDMISINIKSAIKSLGEILGESISEDVLNKLFEKFCVGK